MAVIGGILESEGKLRIDIVNYLTDDPNSAPNAIVCDASQIPPYPEHIPGKAHLLYVNPNIKNPISRDFWFEEINIPLTPEEEQKQLLELLKERLENIEKELPVIKADIVSLKNKKAETFA